MTASKSHATNVERLHELTERQEYLNEFINKLMITIQRPNNMHLLKSQPYNDMMRKLSFIQEMREKFKNRGNELSTLSSFSPKEMEELHFIRMLDSGHIAGMWIFIKEFVQKTNLNIEIDERRI